VIRSTQGGCDATFFPGVQRGFRWELPPKNLDSKWSLG